MRLSVYVAPSLRARWGAAIGWTWRTLLVGVGWPWVEVGAEAARCDVAYAPPGEAVPLCLLRIDADAGAWTSLAAAEGSGTAAPVAGLLALCAPERWAATLIGRESGVLRCPHDPIAACYGVLCGSEERHWLRNAFGQLEPVGSPFAGEAARLGVPVSAVGLCLQETLRACGVAIPAVPRWPGGKTWAACATHDVDYPEVVRWLEPARVVRRQGRRGLAAAAQVLAGRKGHWHFASWVRLEAELGLRSAFYFVGRRGSLAEYALGTRDPFYDVRGPRFVALFQALEGAGAEVGLHASYRACEAPTAFAREKRTLEGALGHAVAGGRHHYWRLLPADPDATLRLHAVLGLEYDCSLAFERQVGWRRGCAWPFQPFSVALGREIGTIQIGTAWMDNQFFGHARQNGIATAADRSALLGRLIAAAAGAGGLLPVDIHDYVFDAALFPGWTALYVEFWQLVLARGDAWIATPIEIARHWARRTEVIAGMSAGLADGPHLAAAATRS